MPHTPGPWFNDHNIEIRAGEWRSICGMRWPFDDPEKAANARLIAAAPDMLAALKGIMASFHESVRTAESLAEFPALQAVAEAIASAEGGK